MFTLTEVEEQRLNRKRSLPKPGTQHGNGGKIRGRKIDKWTDKRPGFNKNSPFIRPSKQTPAGQFIEPHDSDDSIRSLASMANGNSHSGITVRRVYKPLRTR